MDKQKEIVDKVKELEVKQTLTQQEAEFLMRKGNAYEKK